MLLISMPRCLYLYKAMISPTQVGEQNDMKQIDLMVI